MNNFGGKEVQIVYRLFQVNCCMETYRETDRDKSIYYILGGLVIHKKGLCSKSKGVLWSDTLKKNTIFVQVFKNKESHKYKRCASYNSW